MKIIGIDYSINSPAVCIKDTDGKFYFMGFHHYKTKPPIIEVVNRGLIHTIRLEMYPDLSLMRDSADRYAFIADRLYKFLFTHIGLEKIKKDSAVFIEDYAYNPKANRNNIIDIVEATTHFKVKFYPNLVNVCNITRIKKTVGGAGNADKTIILDKFIENFKTEDKRINDLPDLMISDRKMDWSKNPFQDMVDAWSVVVYGISIKQEK